MSKNEITNFELRLQVPEDHIRQVFATITDYADREILDMDLLIRGMAFKASAPVSGTDPDGNTVQTTPLSLFVRDLIQIAVEAGSRGVSSYT